MEKVNYRASPEWSKYLEEARERRKQGKTLVSEQQKQFAQQQVENKKQEQALFKEQRNKIITEQIRQPKSLDKQTTKPKEPTPEEKEMSQEGIPQGESGYIEADPRPSKKGKPEKELRSDGGMVVNLRLPYIALPYQREIDADPHRFKVVVASRRVGKTVMSLNMLLKWALTREVPKDTAFWYIAPYYHQAKTIAWNLLLRYVPQQLWARKPNESSLTLYLTNGRTIVLKGADNPYGLEGTALGGLVVDEISAMAQWKQLWDYSLRPMLADYKSPAIFISKPRGFNHFHDLAKLGDHKKAIEGEPRAGVDLDNDFITYRYETEINCTEHNNGYIAHEEIEAARRTLPIEAFDQEWRAKFTRYTGLVHKDFDRLIHVIPNMELPREWHRWRFYDFGSNDPMASIKMAEDSDGNWFIEECIKQRDIGINDFVEKVKEQDVNYLDMDGADTIPGIGDPTGRMWIREMNRQKLSIRKAIKTENTSETSWVQLGIDRINEKLKLRENHIVFLPDHEGTKVTNAPSLFILDRPSNFQLVAELETLSYKETNEGISRSDIADSNDRSGHYDLLACLRYGAVSVGKKLAFVTLSQPSIAPEYYRNYQILEKIKPVYTPAEINFNDSTARAVLERAADMEIVHMQMVN